MDASPFGQEFDEERYFLTAGQHEVLARAAYAIEQRHPVGCITGRPGIGKTFLLKQLARQIRASGRIAISLCSPSDDGEVIHGLAEQLGLPCWHRESTQPTWPRIREQVRGLQLTGRPVVVLIDLQNDTAVRESLSRLHHWARGEFLGAMTVIVASQPSQQAHFIEAERFAVCRMEIPNWNDGESATFIQHRLSATEDARVRFTDAAIRTIADFSQGVPRDLLRICDLVWNAARVDHVETVDSDIAIAAIREWTTVSGDSAQFTPADDLASERTRSDMFRAATEFAIH